MCEVIDAKNRVNKNPSDLQVRPKRYDIIQVSKAVAGTHFTNSFRSIKTVR